MGYRLYSSVTETAVHLGENTDTALVFGVIVLVCIQYFIRKWKNRKLPPGPVGIPVLGYYPFLKNEPGKKLYELGKKYGNVIGLYLGPRYMVFLNDWEAMKDGLGQNASIDRPPACFGNLPYKLGFGGSNGAEWLETRRFSTKTMKDIGLQSTRLEDSIQEEVSDLVLRISERGDRPQEVRSFFCDSFACNIITLLLGERRSHGDPVIRMVSDSVDAILEYTPTVGMMNFSPTLSKILQFLGLEKKHLLMEKIQDFTKSVSDTVDDTIKNPDCQTEYSFISTYYEGIEDVRKKNQDSYLTEDSLKGTVMSLLAGGSETSRTTLIFTLIAMADHPDKQQKVHDELDKVVGKDSHIRWSDRFKVPYTFATILESMRWRTIVPLSSTREASEDMIVQGYVIPKGAYISANMWAVHNDPKYWEKPDQFIPERFLLDDGKKVNTAPESFSPFSYGRRMCPGKLIAYMEILQYFTMLMQNFKIASKDGKKVKYDELLGLTYQATNVELRFIKR